MARNSYLVTHSPEWTSHISAAVQQSVDPFDPELFEQTVKPFDVGQHRSSFLSEASLGNPPSFTQTPVELPTIGVADEMMHFLPIFFLSSQS